jgi:hypothetical protein
MSRAGDRPSSSKRYCREAIGYANGSLLWADIAQLRAHSTRRDAVLEPATRNVSSRAGASGRGAIGEVIPHASSLDEIAAPDVAG